MRGDDAAEPSAELVSVATSRTDTMHELHAELRRGQVTLPQAFRELGLGFDPTVSEEAAAFAVESIDAFADLFNACIDLQETWEKTALSSNLSEERQGLSLSGGRHLNLEGARKITMYAGAEPDNIDHAAFSGVPGAAGELQVGALSLVRPSPGPNPSRGSSPAANRAQRERRRSREIDGSELSTGLSPGDPPCRRFPAGSAAARAPRPGLEESTAVQGSSRFGPIRGRQPDLKVAAFRQQAAVVQPLLKATQPLLRRGSGGDHARSTARN